MKHGRASLASPRSSNEVQSGESHPATNTYSYMYKFSILAASPTLTDEGGARATAGARHGVEV